VWQILDPLENIDCDQMAEIIVDGALSRSDSKQIFRSPTSLPVLN
jgi:hypothetical protein